MYIAQWGDVAGVVAECATRVLKTVSPAPKPKTRNPKEPPFCPTHSQTAVLHWRLVTICTPQPSIPYPGSAGDAEAAVGPQVFRAGFADGVRGAPVLQTPTSAD